MYTGRILNATNICNCLLIDSIIAQVLEISVSCLRPPEGCCGMFPPKPISFGLLVHAVEVRMRVMCQCFNLFQALSRSIQVTCKSFEWFAASFTFTWSLGNFVNRLCKVPPLAKDFFCVFAPEAVVTQALRPLECSPFFSNLLPCLSAVSSSWSALSLTSSLEEYRSSVSPLYQPSQWSKWS